MLRLWRIACISLASLIHVSSAFAEPHPAKSAHAFVDSIGVNTHYGNGEHVGGNAYADRRIDAKLAALGVRHIRDHSWNDTALKLVGNLHRKHSIRATLVLGETTRSPAQIVALIKAHPAYEAVEGLNEPDFAKRTYVDASGKQLADVRADNDYAATRAFQEVLYDAMKADPKTKQIPVLSPAMGRSNRSQYLLPIRFDVAALHRYAWEGPAALEPSAGLDQAIENMAKLRGDKPLWATESGYYNEPASHARSVPENIAGKYTPRLLCEFFNRGVARTFLYELADQGPDKTQREQNFGLVRFDMTEKPAFIALKNLIDLLKEPKSDAFTAQSLDYTLNVTGGGDLGRIHQTLLQKRDGRFYLMVWQEVLSYDAEKKTEIATADLPVTLALSKPFDARTYLPNDSVKPAATHRGVTSINLGVPDRVLVVELSPAK